MCDDSFTSADAQVVCRQLGFSTTYAQAYRSAHYGEGIGIVWLDSVRCYGYESRLSYCGHAGWGIEDCTHSEDVAVSCSKLSLFDPCCYSLETLMSGCGVLLQ